MQMTGRNMMSLSTIFIRLSIFSPRRVVKGQKSGNDLPKEEGGGDDDDGETDVSNGVSLLSALIMRLSRLLSRLLTKRKRRDCTQYPFLSVGWMVLTSRSPPDSTLSFPAYPRSSRHPAAPNTGRPEDQLHLYPLM